MNIFNELRKMPAEYIALEIVLIEQLNVVNMAKNAGNRFFGSIAEFAGSFVKNSQEQNVSVHKNLSDDIVKKCAGMDILDSVDMVEQLKNVMIKKFGFSDDEYLNKNNQKIFDMQDISEERLTFLLLNAASGLYGVPEGATCNTKIEKVYIYYNNDLINSLHQIICNQDITEMKRWDRELQLCLDAAPIEKKRLIQKKIYAQEFTGHGVGRVLRKEKDCSGLEYVSSLLDMKAFDYVSGYVDTAKYYMKSLKKPSVSVAAQLIWFVRRLFPDNFKIDETKIPSYDIPEKLALKKKEHAEFGKLIKKRLESEKQIHLLEQSLKNDREVYEKITEEKNTVEDKYLSVVQEFERMEKKKEDYISGKYGQDETKLFYKEVNDNSRERLALENKLTELNKKITQIQKSINESENKYGEYIGKCREVIARSNMQLSYYSANLKALWLRNFTHLKFENEVFGQVVLSFSIKDTMEIERKLIEINRLSDYNACDSRKDVIMCSVGDSGKVRIIHNGNVVTSIER